MNEFFHVVGLEEAAALAAGFPRAATETVDLARAHGRVLAADLRCAHDLPGFRRSIMDGFAVQAASTWGATDGSPALLAIVGSVAMGLPTHLVVGPGQAATILTGGMLPAGADAVVMVEHTEPLDDRSIEVSRSVAPGQNVVQADEDAAAGQIVLTRGARLRPQEAGLLAALGRTRVEVFRRPVVAVLSTGDEVVPAEAEPTPGQVRDVNTTTLCAMAERTGAVARPQGIVADRRDALDRACRDALAGADMLLVSGGSSVGSRDLTLEVLAALPDAEILAHGVAMKPGKPTIIARVGTRSVWGLPGHVTSAMVVFHVLVRRFLDHLCGLAMPSGGFEIPALLSRNLASVHGREDFARVRLETRAGELWAVPLPGGSGLIRSLVGADGLVRIDRDTEGLDRGARVSVIPL